MAAVAHGGVGQVTSKGDPIGLGWALYYLALAALMLLAGCLPCTTAGQVRCVGGYATQVCSGSPGQWQDLLDCTTTQPPTVCVQPDAGVARCQAVAK